MPAVLREPEPQAPLGSPRDAEPPSSADGRRHRADGLESRRAILAAAARLVPVLGIDGLSIRDLAEHIGMSKSGLYAHFQSKEELQLATIDTAAEIFEHDVIARIDPSLAGVARILALNDAFMCHLERRTFPGGCFFATVAIQLAGRPGRVRDRVTELRVQWMKMVMAALHDARAAGEIRKDVDLDQLFFEITAMMAGANYGWTTSLDATLLAREKVAVRATLRRAGARV